VGRLQQPLEAWADADEDKDFSRRPPPAARWCFAAERPSLQSREKCSQGPVTFAAWGMIVSHDRFGPTTFGAVRQEARMISDQRLTRVFVELADIVPAVIDGTATPDQVGAK
jgi:hypothetical protein